MGSYLRFHHHRTLLPSQYFYQEHTSTRLDSNKVAEKSNCTSDDDRSTNSSSASSICGTSFSKTQKKTYKCTFCGKSFSKPSALQPHVYTHTGEKPFVCHISGCSKRFSVISNLRRHIKVHAPKRKTALKTRMSCEERILRVRQLASMVQLHQHGSEDSTTLSSPQFLSSPQEQRLHDNKDSVVFNLATTDAGAIETSAKPWNVTSDEQYNTVCVQPEAIELSLSMEASIDSMMAGILITRHEPENSSTCNETPSAHINSYSDEPAVTALRSLSFGSSNTTSGASVDIIISNEWMV